MQLLKKLATIPLVLSMTILAGCLTIPQKPVKPVKPSIKAEYKIENVCFSRADASSLFQYIIELEAGYE